jgi:hypothetical protein
VAESEWLDKFGLTEYLALDSPRTVEWMVYKGTDPTPRYLFAGRWRWRRADVDAWAEAHRIESEAEAH